MDKLQEIVEQFKDKAPDMVKDNKGALMGAVIGYLLTNNEQAKSAILGAVAGAVIADKEKTSE